MNGILGLEIKARNISKVRDNSGRPVKLAEWGTFPDYPSEEKGATSENHCEQV